MRRFLLFLTLLLVPTLAGAQGNTNTLPPACTAATLLTTCVPQVAGVRARVVDAASAGVCTGGGGTLTVCEFDGSAWIVTSPSGGASGTWVGANDGTLTEAVAGTFTFTKDTAGTVTITAADDDAVAALNILAGGAAALTLGGATGTSVILDTEGLDFNLDGLNAGTGSFVNSATGTIVLDFRDYADTTDDDMAHVTMAVNCTDTGSGTEDCDLQIQATQAGSAEERILIDGDGYTDFLNASPRVVAVPAASCATYNCGAPQNTNVHNSYPVFTDGGMWAGPVMLTQNALGTMGNGLAEVEILKASHTLCAPIGGGTEALDSTDYKEGTYSYTMTFDASVAAAEGFDCDITGHAAVGSASIHMWIKSSVAYASGDLEVVLDDGGAAEATSILPAYLVPDVWEYVWVDVTGDCAATCADLDGFFIQTTAQAPATFNNSTFKLDVAGITIDNNSWNTTPNSITDGILSVIAFPDVGGPPSNCLEWTCWMMMSYGNPRAAGTGLMPILDSSADTWLATFIVSPDG